MVRIALYDNLSPLAVLLLAYFFQRHPCRKLSAHETFKGYRPREIGKEVQALHRVGLLDQDGQTSGSQFVVTPAGRLLVEHFLNQRPIPVRRNTDRPNNEGNDSLPILVLLMLQFFLQTRSCWRLDRYYDFQRYQRREMSKCLQALNTVGLVAKRGQTSGSQYITTPVGRMLYARYGDALLREPMPAPPSDNPFSILDDWEDEADTEP